MAMAILLFHFKGSRHRLGSLGDDHDRGKSAAVMTASQAGAELVDIKRNLRDQHSGCSPSNAS
jgi:hypothetical protein